MPNTPTPPINVPIHAGWKPDLSLEDITKAGGLKTANNIIRAKKYYWPVLTPEILNPYAMSGAPQAGVVAQSSDGIGYNFAATRTKLYAFTNNALTDITKTGLVGGGRYWSFAVYGDWLIASNFIDNIQVLKGISTGHSGTKFADLGGTPPKAKFILMNHGHLIMASLVSGGVAYPKKLQWSARENVEQFTASVTTGADSQEAPEIDGVITGLAGIGDAFAILSENSISTGYYIGGQYTFAFKYNVVRNIGCAFPGSLISIGNFCFFWSRKSIWMFDGTTATEIGGEIKEALFGMLNMDHPELVSAMHDPKNNLVMWLFATGTNTAPNKCLAFNYSENAFTTIDLPAYFTLMGVSATGGTVATDTGWLNFSTTATVVNGGTLAWANPNNALVEDDVYATAGPATNAVTHLLRLTGATMNIPSNATITGIAVKVGRHAAQQTTGGGTDQIIQLCASGAAIGNNRALIGLVSWWSSDHDLNVGGAGDLWGAAITPSIVNNSTFGFQMQAFTGQAANTLYVDSIQIKIYYSEPLFSASDTELMCCDYSGKINAFTGAPLVATIETGEVHDTDSVISVNRLFIPVEGTTAEGTGYTKHRYSQKSGQLLSTGRPIRSDGFVDLRSTDRRISCYATINNFDKLGNNIELYGSISGKR